jgi:hypothetical protein
MADGSTPITGQASTALTSITAIAAAIGERDAQLAAFTGPHPDEDRLGREIRDLWDLMSKRRPRNVREALATAALAASILQELDEPGGYQHELALRLLAQLVDGLQAEAGMTAGEMGLGQYAKGLHNGPIYTVEDANEQFLATHRRAYLAAVARFAPGFYRFVERELAEPQAAGTAR